MEREHYITALRALDPGRPAAGAQVARRVGWDRFEELRVQVEAGTRFRIALHGSAGVGKTTELLSWKERLGAMGVRVDYVAFHPRAEALHGLLRGRASQGAELLLVDGLDLRPEDADQWFGQGTPVVDPDLPALVAVAPTVVARWPADRRDPHFTLMHLPPFPVIGRDGRARWDAVSAMADMLRQRLAGEEALLEKPSLLKRIGLMSGGVPRDAIRILRGAVLTAAARSDLVTTGQVVAGERELRQDLEQSFVHGDLAVLRNVLDRQRFLEPDPRLLTMGAVLTYEDAEGIYALPHPLLRAALGADGLESDAAVAGNVP